MPFEISEIKQAYIKLKSYIYYDNTDILLRKKLVEFESGRTQDLNFIFNKVPKPYKFKLPKNTSDISEVVNLKLNEITDALNRYHKSPDFFNYFLTEISVQVYPKKFKSEKLSSNFITNRRTRTDYKVERVTAFIDAPIELHILSVLWIIKFGVALDSSLNENCLGNRLLLDYKCNSVVQGSGLFKPYFNQYQKWRDESVKTAKDLLDNDKNVLFLNLDIKDYFHSVRIPISDLHLKSENNIFLQHLDNLKEIFKKIHVNYSKKISKNYKIPDNFYSELEPDDKGNIQKVILPIGLLSSFVLANNYLKKFDDRITQNIKPAYYGRYVDDILIVLSDPNPFNDETDKDFKFNFKEYVAKVRNSGAKSSEIDFEESDLNVLEKYIIKNFTPIINLVNSPFDNDYKTENGRVFKINSYESLFCQSEKTLLYYFEKGESDLVIDKLKKELDEKTSEFKDLPDSEDENSFEKNAYHLNYDGTDGKIRTLKDYTENRYGLTIYLSNKIFSALRQEKKISEKEKNQVIKFFKGLNCLTFYRLWEKIFTYHLVNNEPESYIDFYVHCVEQIDKVKGEGKINDQLIRETLIQYLDSSHELAISLNPNFISKSYKTERNFEYRLNEISNSSSTFFMKSLEATRTDSLWFKRFRETNMLRHQYIVHPLLSYTDLSNGKEDLTSLRINFKNYKINPNLLKNSPRRIKFWECCLATAYEEFSNFKANNINFNNEHFQTNILGFEKFTNEDDSQDSISKFYLFEAYEKFKIGNEDHIPHYDLKDENYRNNFFIINDEIVNYDRIKPIGIQEITVNKNDKLTQPKIAFANTVVEEQNIVKNLKKETNFSSERYNKFKNILKIARTENADILLFPEFFIPINLLSSLTRYAEKNQTLTITGLEHIILENTAFNFIVSIQPLIANGVKDATVIFRLKNHYAPTEEHLINGLHLSVPKPTPYRYDIINWRNIYFSTYYCFELADAFHRSLFKGKVDLIIGVEWNKDTPYFSNIVETCTRDLHVYFAQVNTSHYGDTRLTQPVDSARKDILRLKGGINDTVLVAKINIYKLREFQRKRFSLTHHDKEYKPLPPDYLLEDVMKRIKNKNILKT